MSFLFIQMGENTNSESMLFYMKQEQASETCKKNNPNSTHDNAISEYNQSIATKSFSNTHVQIEE